MEKVKSFSDLNKITHTHRVQCHEKPHLYFNNQAFINWKVAMNPSLDHHLYKSTFFPAIEDYLVPEFYPKSVVSFLIWTSINKNDNI
jgi:hypothetical protein